MKTTVVARLELLSAWQTPEPALSTDISDAELMATLESAVRPWDPCSAVWFSYKDMANG